MVCDPINLKSLEQANLQKQKVGCLGEMGKMGEMLKGIGFL